MCTNYKYSTVLYLYVFTEFTILKNARCKYSGTYYPWCTVYYSSLDTIMYCLLFLFKYMVYYVIPLYKYMVYCALPLYKYMLYFVLPLYKYMVYCVLL